MLLIVVDAEKLYDQVENVYKGAKTPARQAYSNVLDMLTAEKSINTVYLLVATYYNDKHTEVVAAYLDRDKAEQYAAANNHIAGDKCYSEVRAVKLV